MDELNEQLSAMVDDELKAVESRLLLRQLTRLPGAADQVGRYLLIRAALHGNRPRPSHDDLAARVALALETEPAFSSAQPTRRVGIRLARPAAGFVIAASVALVAIVLWPRPQPTAPQVLDTASLAPAAVAPLDVAPVAAPVAMTADSATTPDMEPKPPTPRQWDRLDPEVRQQLNLYLVDHSEYSTDGRFDGATTYVRIAAQDGK